MALRACHSVGQVLRAHGLWRLFSAPSSAFTFCAFGSDPGLCGAALIIPTPQKETVFSDVTLEIGMCVCVCVCVCARARQMDGWSESVFVRGREG